MVRRLPRHRGRSFWLVFLIFAALLAARIYRGASQPPEPPPLNESTYRVQRVVDGDTFVLENRNRVRLIGIDTPEMNSTDPRLRQIAEEAKRFTQQFVQGGTVDLRFDRERKDHYGRMLAYVYVDGRMLNEELLRRGLARGLFHLNFSDRIKRMFRQAESEAKEAKLGIWSPRGN